MLHGATRKAKLPLVRASCHRYHAGPDGCVWGLPVRSKLRDGGCRRAIACHRGLNHLLVLSIPKVIVTRPAREAAHWVGQFRGADC